MYVAEGWKCKPELLCSNNQIRLSVRMSIIELKQMCHQRIGDEYRQ